MQIMLRQQSEITKDRIEAYVSNAIEIVDKSTCGWNGLLFKGKSEQHKRRTVPYMFMAVIWETGIDFICMVYRNRLAVDAYF